MIRFFTFAVKIRHQQFPERLLDSIVVNCSEATEDRIPTFKEKLQQWFDDAAWHAPSIIFFDDLDRLIPAEIEVCTKCSVIGKFSQLTHDVDFEYSMQIHFD